MGTFGTSTMITGFHSAVFSYTETPLNVGSVSGGVFTDAPQGSPADFDLAKLTVADTLIAFNDLAARPNGIDPGAGQLGGLTLTPGVYKSDSGAFLITGSDLTLDAQGNADAVWIFQMASTLTVGTPQQACSIILTNGADAANIFWQVGSSATINGAGGGSMAGTIIASAAISFSTAGNMSPVVLNGRALVLNGPVTMVNTIIDADSMAAAAPIEIPVEVPASPIILSGSAAADVVAVTTGGGFVNVENNGGLVTVTETGTVSNTGNGKVTIRASGAEVISITHTGDEDYFYPAL